MYSKIYLCFSEKEDEVLTRQLSMLSERHHAEVERVDAGTAAQVIEGGEGDVLFISDDKALLAKAVEKGIATNDPASMKESYEKAMEMLKAIGGRR